MSVSPNENTGTRLAPCCNASLMNPYRFFRIKSNFPGNAFKASGAPELQSMTSNDNGDRMAWSLIENILA